MLGTVITFSPANLTGGRVLYYAIVILLIAGTAFHLLVTLRGGLNEDELIYMAMTKEVALGRPVYLTYVDHQPPGVAFAGVPFVLLFGADVFAAKAAVVAYNVLFIVAVAIIAYAITHSRDSAIFAAALGGFFASVYGQRIGVNVSSYAAIFTTLGLACAINPFVQKRLWLWVVLGGILAALALLTKPSIAIELPAILLVIYTFRRSFRSVAQFAIGIGVGTASALLYFALSGQLSEMLYVSFTMNSGYIGAKFSSGEAVIPLSYRLEWVKSMLLPRVIPYLSAMLVLALVIAICNARLRRFRTLNVVGFWAVLAIVNAMLAVSMSFRYFYHVFAPLSILGVLSLDEAIRARGVQLALVALVPLLTLPTRPEIVGTEPVHFAQDYQQDIAFLEKNLDKRDCLLGWGWLGGIHYFSDYRSCSRVALSSNMMIQEIYDLRHIRMWYLQDILNTRPKLIAVQPFWSYFPQMQRLAQYHVKDALFRATPSISADGLEYPSRDWQITYYAMDWSHYSESTGSIDKEIALKGYDVLPMHTVAPGNTIEVILYWQALKPPAGDYQGFVHLVSMDYQRQIVGADGLPTEPYLPTSAWRQGEIIVGRPHQLVVPLDVRPGKYALVAGMYKTNGESQIVPMTHYENGAVVPFISLGLVDIKAGAD
jgi:4-amino-4-deoxy-L-arabinose transferase-like glycosyltransferase